ncbi:MAG: nucleotide exchange factor GrpE [Clostridia bacterium]|nr:nucleotide exchange factor GrpE [Clostridia bacterium]
MTKKTDEKINEAAEEEIKEEVQETQSPEGEAAEEEAAESELEKKCKDLNEKYMRTLAEYDNYRKRTIKEKESIYPEAKAVVVEKFLAVADNLERALASAEEKGGFYEGVLMVKKQMDECLSSLGVEEIKAVGEAFDPLLHNAVMHVEDENLGESIVAEEFQKGYRIGDRIVRHSMVKVAN